MASPRDPMPPAAAEAFDKAIALNPKDPRARYFMAVKKDIAGDHKGAIDEWFALLADTPQGAPWEADLRRTIEQVGKIHKIDLQTDTPYNTYTRYGLPPTPIALPGRAAIHAVLHPAQGDALYFVAKGDGTHVFSATLAEQNAAVRKYILGKKTQ